MDQYYWLECNEQSAGWSELDNSLADVSEQVYPQFCSKTLNDPVVTVSGRLCDIWIKRIIA